MNCPLRSVFGELIKRPITIFRISSSLHTTSAMQNPATSEKAGPKVAVGVVGCGKGVVYLMSLERPADIGLHLGNTAVLVAEIFELAKDSHGGEADCKELVNPCTLVHLSRGGAQISMFAPDVEQMHAINHMKGEPLPQNRNVLEESARIARGKIDPLSNLRADSFDAVIFPGGFGAAKNLSTFAVDGTNMTVNTDVERVLKDFHARNKPIGLCCIAPVLAAKIFPGCEVTVGNSSEDGGRWPYAGTVEAVKAMGANHIVKDVCDSHTDTKNKIVTSPAFMCDASFYEIFDSVGKMVEGVMKLLK